MLDFISPPSSLLSPYLYFFERCFFSNSRSSFLKEITGLSLLLFSFIVGRSFEPDDKLGCSFFFAALRNASFSVRNFFTFASNFSLSFFNLFFLFSGSSRSVGQSLSRAPFIIADITNPVACASASAVWCFFPSSTSKYLVIAARPFDGFLFPSESMTNGPSWFSSDHFGRVMSAISFVSRYPPGRHSMPASLSVCSRTSLSNAAFCTPKIASSPANSTSARCASAMDICPDSHWSVS